MRDGPNVASNRSTLLRCPGESRAKAGIHLATTAFVDGWIPAFAGMTSKETGLARRYAEKQVEARQS